MLKDYICSRKIGNIRHKIVIAATIILLLVIQLFPVGMIIGFEQPLPHGSCILEYPTDPTCKAGGTNDVYVMYEDGDVVLEDDVNSCEEYYANPHFGSIRSGWFNLIAFIVICFDAITIVVCLFNCAVAVFKFLAK